MDKLVRVVMDMRDLHLHQDDDVSDRMSRRYTSSLLVLFAAVVSARQYWGEAVHCWCPEQCASNHEKYANLYCWVSDTYFVSFESDMPQEDEPRIRKITYYQWTPVILVSQAIMFTLPYLLWKILNRRSGIDITDIMEAAVTSRKAMYAESKEKTLRYAVLMLDRHFLTHRERKTGCWSRMKHILSKRCCLFYGKFYGNYLTFSYIVVKTMYLVNAVAQLFLLDVILGYDYHMFGIRVLRHFLYGEQWEASERFPRVTLCDFRIRQNTNVHQYTVQCVLPINIFNEKIFVIVWFWFVLVCLLTAYNLMQWTLQSIHWQGQLRYVRRRLRAMDAIHGDSNHLKRFVQDYLRRDGLFLLRLVSKNAGDLIASELLCGLWENYGPKHRLLEEGGSRSGSRCARAGQAIHQPSTPQMEVV